MSSHTPGHAIGHSLSRTEEAHETTSLNNAANHDPVDKVTLYINRTTVKKMKKIAIDRDQTFSELARNVFEKYVKGDEIS